MWIQKALPPAVSIQRSGSKARTDAAKRGHKGNATDATRDGRLKDLIVCWNAKATERRNIDGIIGLGFEHRYAVLP